jgi:hypothetical protein
MLLLETTNKEVITLKRAEFYSLELSDLRLETSAELFPPVLLN